MKIKKYIQSAVFVVMVTLMAACGSQLDVKPVTSIDASTALLTSNDVKGALVGAYSNMGANDLYSGGIQVYSDLVAFANDFEVFGTFQELTQMNNKVILTNNASVAAVWLEAYATINTVNEVLNA